MRPKRQPGVTSRALADGEVMVLSADGARATVLNTMGAIVWQLCDGDHSVLQIAELIGKRFADQPLDRLTADVTQLVDELLQDQLVGDEDSCGAPPSGS